MLHELKTWPHPFDAIVSGHKKHEVRRADRPFSFGDVVRLREWDPESAEYSGREIYAIITYVSEPGTWGLPKNVVVFSIEIKMSSSRIPPGTHEDVT